MNQTQFLRATALLAALALALAGCTSGMVLGDAASCSGSTVLLTQVTGECSGTIESLTETDTQNIAVQTADLAPYATVEFEVTVDSGRVNVIFVDTRGDKRTYEAAPGSPATGSVRIQLDAFNQIKFDLEPVGGAASNVHYELSFVCDCMP